MSLGLLVSSRKLSREGRNIFQDSPAQLSHFTLFFAFFSPPSSSLSLSLTPSSAGCTHAYNGNPSSSPARIHHLREVRVHIYMYVHVRVRARYTLGLRTRWNISAHIYMYTLARVCAFSLLLSLLLARSVFAISKSCFLLPLRPSLSLSPRL